MPKYVEYNEEYIRSRMTIVDNGCWIWNGHLDRDGYGQANSRLGTLSKAHRLAFHIFKGSITCDVVRHTCDNPPCCNPDHLIQGSFRDNLNDAVERGRIDLKAKSDHANTYTRIPQATVDKVLELAKKGELRRIIAQQFGISRQTVDNIINRNK